MNDKEYAEYIAKAEKADEIVSTLLSIYGGSSRDICKIATRAAKDRIITLAEYRLLYEVLL